MSSIYLPIDEKSLYYNIHNDNIKGHVCTVATPIKQGHKLREDLNEVYKIPKQLSQIMCNQLSDELLKKSKTKCRLNNVFVFDKIKVNGEVVDVDACYCFYVKEEVDSSKAQYGRIQLHYPISLKIDFLDVDNSMVLNKISAMYNNYAFRIEGFEYDFDTDYLNFRLLIVGYQNIPYSKVFINNKGAGNKFNLSVKNYYDVYDVEIMPLRELYGEEANAENFEGYMNKAYIEAKRLTRIKLKEIGATDIFDVSSIYPYSIYDFRYSLNGEIMYAIVNATYSNVSYFNLSVYQYHFFDKFSNCSLYIVRNVGKNDKITIENVSTDDLSLYDESVNSYRYVKL